MARVTNVASLYNPQIQDKEQLKNGFVVRLDIFKRLFRELRQSKMQYPEQHYLIQGDSGTGKTTLLLRLSYAVEKDEQLNPWLIPIAFNEEEYGLRRLYKLWLRLAELLEEKQNVFEGLVEEMNKLSENFGSDNDYERALFELLTSRLRQHHKKILLFVDNFGDLLNKFNEHEAHRLRKILQTSSELRIFAASSRTIEAFHEYRHPFYEFFKIEHLKGLNAQQTRELFLKLGEIYDEPNMPQIIAQQWSKIETIRRLTGGVIRQLVILFEILVIEKDADVFTLLECLLDRCTPGFKSRMDKLPPQQQEIVEAIAHNWDAVSVKEISERTRMESKVISAQLNQLVKNEVVSKIHTDTKNHLYRIADRFFNIWYLVRLARNGSIRRVYRLVQFIDFWCTPNAAASTGNGMQIVSEGAGRQQFYELHRQQSPSPQLRQQLPWVSREFMALLKDEQYELLLDFVGNEQAMELNVRDSIKPLYYALMYFVQDRYPKAFLRMGAELGSTVEEMIDLAEE